MLVWQGLFFALRAPRGRSFGVSRVVVGVELQRVENLTARATGRPHTRGKFSLGHLLSGTTEVTEAVATIDKPPEPSAPTDSPPPTPPPVAA